MGVPDVDWDKELAQCKDVEAPGPSRDVGVGVPIW